MSRRNGFIVSVLLVFSLALSGIVFAQRVIDLDKVWGDMRILGAETGDYTGFGVAYGDINGDGFKDIIIGATRASPGERRWAGAAYVVFGSGSPASTIDLSTQSADITIYGARAIDNLGVDVASRDVNGDGYDDIIIGADGVHRTYGGYVGAVYVLFGCSNPSSFIDLSTQLADITIYGNYGGSNTGHSVSSGDINNDGYADIIIGAPGANPEGRWHAGEAYVIFGSSSLPNLIDLHSQSADIIIYGAHEVDNLGAAVANGDVNGDSYEDMVISSRFADPSGRGDAGETYVIFGSGYLPSIIDLSTAQSADIKVYGANSGDWLGMRVASGDINSDGCSDIIIGAPLADPPERGDAGKTYIIFGSGYLPSIIDLSSKRADITVYGDDAIGWLGYAVASGDINGDSFKDIIIGAPYADSNGGIDGGMTYVIFGGSFTSPPYTIDLETPSADITVYGDDGGDKSGHEIASGDVNGDGYDDVIIGAPYANSSTGETYVIFGFPEVVAVEIDIKPGSFPNSINLRSRGTVPVTIFSTSTFDATTVDPTTITLASAPIKLRRNGTPMASFEDVNGDGLLDLVVHVQTKALQLSKTETEAVLEGKTFDGTCIRGVDSLRVVP